MNPTTGITSVRVFSYEKLSNVSINPEHLGIPKSKVGSYLLMILETDTDSIRLVYLDQERVL
jgi:hypothetical protein